MASDGLRKDSEVQAARANAVSSTVQAAVVEERGGPFRIQPLELDAPREDEVLVDIRAVGICHTDLACRDQHLPLRLPQVFGHEGAGEVRAVGQAVKGVQPGDRVVLSFASCGACPSCEAARPAQCVRAFQFNYAGRRPDGSANLHRGDTAINGSFFGQSSFSTQVLAHASSVTVVDSDMPWHLLAPLGCGVQTGVGAVMNSLRCPEGATLLIIGAGTVGLCAVMAARMAQCRAIVVVDRNPGRLKIAVELGASDTLLAGDDLASQLRSVLKRGADFALDCVGTPEIFQTAFAALAAHGTLGLVGVPRPDALGAIRLQDVLFGKSVRGIIEGDAVPQRFIPQMMDWMEKGHLPLDRLVTRYPFAQIQSAVEDMEAGRVIKPVLEMP